MLNKLAKLREERLQDDEGFTLIELLVVVVIIGILVAIAIPLYLNYRTGAENKAAQSDVRGAVSAVESCIADNGNRAPTAAAGVTADGTTGKKVINLTCLSGATGGVASLSDNSAGQQTINVSDNVKLTYTAAGTDGKYTIVGTFGTGHKTYTYTSVDGKTATS